ncbi:MAG: phosphoglycerate kinase [Chloroflexi bacterium]|nr:phosphoglycerate kinase [Chloroflexota bacterium]MYK60846.1 phosphoglycerate kinase [Chloroflexota bacterium]
MPMIEDVEVSGKRVLLRADLNVTFKPGSTRIADDSRIHASVATIELLRSRGARVVLCSHLGRPKGKVVPEMRIEPVRERMSEVLGVDVGYAGGPVGEEAERVVESLNDSDVAMLENLRFDPGEEDNDADFSNSLASLADVFVNDAFGASHRAHASIVGVADLLPTYAGLLMRAEIVALERAVDSAERPAVAILGGSKVADKLGVVKNLAPNTDAVLIGGGMVSAMLAAQGKSVGSVDVSDDEMKAAKELLDDPIVVDKLHLPTDVIVAEEFSGDSRYIETSADSVPESGFILDIGSQTISNYVDAIGTAEKIVWNGPMGLFEWEAFSGGTQSIASAISDNESAFKLAGGGSTVEAINSLGIADAITHISTGGGASLEFLEGKTLPGIAALHVI